MSSSMLKCAGCGWVAGPPGTHAYPFRCGAARAGDDIDHVMVRCLDPAAVRFPGETDDNPFLRYRSLLHSHHVAAAHGLGDADYVAMVEALNSAVADTDGVGFRTTPLVRSAMIESRIGVQGGGALWIKDETGNVSRSHKARHLAGVMLYLQVIERLGLAPPERPLLAIASCGNAALAAAVVARAAGWRLEVFVPPDARRAVLARLRALGAAVRSCPRTAGTRGDPCYRRFQDAVAAGALPFTCQGNQNGLTIEGGATLGYEIIDQLGDPRLDRLFVQVGGGALASACIQAFSDAVVLGRLEHLPRLHAVQTRGAFPLWRAWRRVAQNVLDRLGPWSDTDSGTGAPGPGDAIIASRIHHDADPSLVDEALADARRHRSRFMWPWEETPRSVAEGILDDETYDWATVVSGMLRTGGYPIVVDEPALEDANHLAREATDIAVTHTGSAGLAGLVEAIRRDPDISNEQVGLIFSGGGGR